MKKSANALLARAHALYAKRLTNEDYSAMSECRSNNELFSYLKSNTSYGKYLEKLPSVQLSRARFENIMNQTLLDRIASLCRFEKLIGEKLYKYFITKNEIATIINCSRHLDTDEIVDLFIIPDFYKKEQSVFGEDMQKARSFDELVAYLKGSPYEKTVNAVMETIGDLNLATLENALYNHLYTETANLIKNSFKGKQAEEILAYFRILSDMIMIETAVRINQFYSDTPGIKANLFISPVSEFSEKQIRALIDSSSLEETMNIIGNTKYKKYFPKNDNRPIERKIREAIVTECTKKIRYSQNPIVCMLCYSTLAENEIKNITHIIEGIKYKLSPDDLSQIIVKGEGVCLLKK